MIDRKVGGGTLKPPVERLSLVGSPVSDLPLGFVGKELLDVKSTKHLVCVFF